ncbi:hypothetical protein [Streptomyces sp. HPF1205]|uniref:hypothetical protein n=1 Tax=Streptomyces sp. HPF1205 TaxID=2873262 RepID=UPI001CEDD34E|nr:hypothetical protein [Streptomyces sp. HPF1205]
MATGPSGAATALQLAVWAANAKGSAKAAGVVHDGVYGTDRLKGSQTWVDEVGADVTFTFTDGPVLQSMRSSGQGDVGLARSLPEAFYTGSPVLTPSLRGRHWGEYTPADLAGRAGEPNRHGVVLLKEQVEASDPMFAVGALLTSADVHRVGTRTEQDRVLTGYRGTVSAAHVAKAVAAGGPGSGVLPWLKESGTRVGTFEVWLGPDHLPYQASIRGDFSDGAFLATFTWSDYGAPVRVTAPPASDTWTAADVARLRAKAAG